MKILYFLILFELMTLSWKLGAFSLKKRIHFPNILKMNTFEFDPNTESFQSSPFHHLKSEEIARIKEQQLSLGNADENSVVGLRKKDIDGFKKALKFLVPIFFCWRPKEKNFQERLRRLRRIKSKIQK